MSGIEGLILLAVVALAAVGLDLLVLWGWRAFRREKASPAQAPAAEPIPPDAAAAAPPTVVRWMLAIESAVSAGYATIRDLTRLAVGMLRHEQSLLRTVVVLACFLTALGLGYASSDQYMVKPWLPWAWIACVAVSLFALLPIGRPQPLDRRDRWMLGVLGLAVLLRVFMLETIPGGFHVDEWGDADFALRYVVPPIDRTISPFVTGHSAQPALYFYVARLSLAVFGERIAGLRMSSVLAGSLAILATFALVSLLANRRTAYLSAVLMATYHFHIHWSRIGLNNIWDTLWVPLILALYVWGWKRDRPAGATLAGLSLGLSQYFYAGSRIGIFLLGYLVIRLWRAERDDARLVGHLGRLIGMAAVVAGPLAVFAVLNPEIFFNRLTSGLLWDPFAAELATTLPPNLPSMTQQFIWTLLSFTAIPEGAGFYRPGVPLVIGLAVPLLLVGVFWQLHRREYLPVIWLALTMFFGGFLLEALPASNHYAVAIPAICWLVASPLEALAGFGRLRWAILALAIIVATDLYFYFGIYAQSPSMDFIHVFPPNPWN
jgi:hypothetical protein